MANLNIRVDEATRSDIERMAHRMGTTTSDLIRTQIAHLLDRRQPAEGAGPVARLTPYDRHLLAAIHDLQAAADPIDEQHHRQRALVLRRGYTLEYAEEFHDLDDELSADDCRFVRNVLNMFRILKHSLANLEPDEVAALGSDARDLKFRGFDGNDSREAAMSGYVDFLMDDGRWEESREDALAADHGNSHWPLYSHYAAMLDRYTHLPRTRSRRSGGRDGLALNLGELQEVLGLETE